MHHENCLNKTEQTAERLCGTRSRKHIHAKSQTRIHDRRVERETSRCERVNRAEVKHTDVHEKKSTQTRDHDHRIEHTAQKSVLSGNNRTAPNENTQRAAGTRDRHALTHERKQWRDASDTPNTSKHAIAHETTRDSNTRAPSAQCHKQCLAVCWSVARLPCRLRVCLDVRVCLVECE